MFGLQDSTPMDFSNACRNICIIGGGNSRKLPVSVKGVNTFTCPILNIETIGKKANILFKLFSLQMSYFFLLCLKSKCYYLLI